MKFLADLHVHSKYSRATAKNLDLENLYLWAQYKGIHIVGTGDFVHPQWFKELEDKLESAENGLFKLKDKFADPLDAQIPESCRADVRFVLTVEISNIYKRHDKVRKVHNLILSPSLQAAGKIQAKLGSIGNISSDGRPILGLDSYDLLDITLDADAKNLFIPAHIWTPWFSALGSMGGFDSMVEAFGDLTKHIFAVETGLSSDPAMNWRLKQLDDFILVSNSDAHSPSKLGREANVFDTDFSYDGIYKALSDKDDKGLVSTLEFFPEEGKYHFDGHRNCQVRWHPKETIKHKGICPACGKPVTVGVANRVEILADRLEGGKSRRWRPYQNIVPLVELIAEVKNTGTAGKAVQEAYMNILAKLGNEFYILLECPIDDIKQAAGLVLAEGVNRMRQGKVEIAAGYDGEFGTIKIFNSGEREHIEQQMSLF
ncbi:MAG: DNA helicase UvrD [Candidatus Omnitrophica bacterium]|nr:DNA helicase UvrD [Candidatus Omnitrophota bacterium]